MSKQLAQHSSLTAEHYSPPLIVEPARRVLGGIDLDPASCHAGNEVVKAATIFTSSGLLLDWSWQGMPTRVFLNPPGGKLNSRDEVVSAGPGRSHAAAWWAKLHEEWIAGHVSAAIFVCFSLSIFRTAQGERGIPPPFAYPFCVPAARVNYDKLDENGARVATSGAPADSAIVFLPNVEHRARHEAAFAQEFRALGAVRL